MAPLTRQFAVWEQGVLHTLAVTRRGVGPVKTHHAGNFWEILFTVGDEWVDYAALVKAELDREGNPLFRQSAALPLRIDSGCQTGQVAGDRTCECRQQLELAQARIQEEGEGLIICIPKQDGRGRGLPFKLGTLLLQHCCGLDTVDAAETLAQDGKIDTRTYRGAIAVLRFLGCGPSFHFRLMTNNPKKMSGFRENGISFEPAELVVPPTPHTVHHLQAKQDRLGHRGLVAVASA